MSNTMTHCDSAHTEHFFFPRVHTPVVEHTKAVEEAFAQAPALRAVLSIGWCSWYEYSVDFALVLGADALVGKEAVVQCAEGGHGLTDARVNVGIRGEQLVDDATEVAEIISEGDEPVRNVEISSIGGVALLAS
jgi:hypothetical protein